MKSKPQDLLVCGHFRLVRKLGTGAFGQIYLAQNKNNPNEKYAAKLQQVNTKFPQLYFQAKMYKYLNSSTGVIGIPKVHAVTTEGQYNIMLMDLLGTSIEDIFVDSNKIMSLKSALILGYQMLERIQYLHERQIIHRDIKPDNFLLGLNNNAHLLYIVDFGLSKKYIKDNKHIPYKQGKQLTGTARYASINTHMGIQQSRRDDIQSIGYVIMYLLRGILPWQNMKAKDTKTKYKMIMDKKISTPAEVLCKGFPQELASFINYARNLKFQEKPDYALLKNSLKSAMKANNIEMDYIYDWTKKSLKKQQQKQTYKIEDGMDQPIVKRQEKLEKAKYEYERQKQRQRERQRERERQKDRERQRLLANSTQIKNAVMSKNKTTVQPGSLNTSTTNNLNSSSNVQKTQVSSTVGKAGLDSIMGQKLVGPKISTVKR